jgi:hypothetical protein
LQELTIVRAKWGIEGMWTDVTKRVRKLATDTELRITVTSSVLGVDPVPDGRSGRFHVRYKLDGGDQLSMEWVEGSVARLPRLDDLTPPPS